MWGNPTKGPLPVGTRYVLTPDRPGALVFEITEYISADEFWAVVVGGDWEFPTVGRLGNILRWPLDETADPNVG
jgi:hypothetical protein